MIIEVELKQKTNENTIISELYTFRVVKNKMIFEEFYSREILEEKPKRRFRILGIWVKNRPEQSLMPEPAVSKSIQRRAIRKYRSKITFIGSRIEK